MFNIIANWIGRIKKEKESETYDMYIDMEGGDNTVVCVSVEMSMRRVKIPYHESG